jgi:hypothetical protein
MNYYTGKIINDLLNDENVHYTRYAFFDFRGGCIKGIEFFYPENRSIKIQIEDFKFIDPCKNDRKWDLDLVLKEKISDIKTLYNIEIP